MLAVNVVAASVLLASAAAAHQGCGQHDVSKRNLGMTDGWAKRQSSESEAAQGTDPTTECTFYSYAPVISAKANFPAIWQNANILSTDTTAQALFASINATINSEVPNIKQKGTPTGNFSAFTPTYPASDPDCWWSYHQCDTPKNANLSPDITNIPEPLSYGLGFDDGPNCSHNAFYDYLFEQNLKATMFYIGSNVMDWPLQAQRAIADGHEICVHTWSHPYMTALSNEQAFAELYYSMEAIKLVTGVTPLCWRPPFGDIDDRIRVIANALNLKSILWEEDSQDWRINTGTPPITQAQIDANYQSIITKAGNGTYATRGTIMLTHELNNFTMSEAVKWLPQLQAAFKHLVPIASAYNWTQPYEETNVTYPDFQGAINGSAPSTVSVPSSNSPSISVSGLSAGTSATASSTSSSSSGSATTGASSSNKSSAANTLRAVNVLPGGLVVLLGLLVLM